MRKGRDGKKRRKEKNAVFSGHYVIASSLPPERRPLERRTLVPIKTKYILLHLEMYLKRKSLKYNMSRICVILYGCDNILDY